MSTHNKQTTKLKLTPLVLIGLIFIAAFSRLVPHLPNFSPLGAIALFGSAYFMNRWLAIFIPLTATWISDVMLNNFVYGAYFDGWVWFYTGFYWQYGSYLLIVLMGMFWFKNGVSASKVAGSAIGASILFFLISNFGVWASATSLYPKTIEGLLACYWAGIPFMKGTLFGNLLYSALLFGSFQFIRQKFGLPLRLKAV